MSNLPLEVVEMLGQTIAKVVPITIVLALVFSVLTHFWACNPGAPWWRKREFVTDICYWFFVPVFARVLRIGLLVLGAGVVFNIHDADTLIAFYDNGHGPLAELPLWLQGSAVPGPGGFHAVLAAPACFTAADSGNTTPSIIPRKSWTGFRLRASTPSTCSWAPSWSTSYC